MTTFAIGLVLKLFKSDTKLYLDVEDIDIFNYKMNRNKAFNRGSHPSFFIWIKSMLGYLRKHNNYFWVNKLHNYLYMSEKCTVVSTKLREKYGGDILLHGPNGSLFEPSHFRKDEMRNYFGLPHNKK